MRGKPGAFLHNAWDVYLHSKLIDTVFDSETDATEVKRSLVNHDGYDHEIEVRQSRARKRRNSAVRLPWQPTPEGHAGDVRREPAGNPRKARKFKLGDKVQRDDGSNHGVIEQGPFWDSLVGWKWRVREDSGNLIWWNEKSTRKYKSNPRHSQAGDDATELQLYVDNDADLYRQQHQPILKNLITKMARGTYDRDKAVKLFMYLAESGAKKYTKEFGGTWHTMFDVPTRRLAAIAWRDAFEGEAKLGNYDNYLPKKYQKRGRPANDNPKRKSKGSWWRFDMYRADGKQLKSAVGYGSKQSANSQAKRFLPEHESDWRYANTEIPAKLVLHGPYPTREAALGSTK